MKLPLRQNLPAITASGILILLALAFLWGQITLPYDGARLRPGSGAITAEGVLVTPVDVEASPLRAGDLVVAMDNRSIVFWSERALSGEFSYPEWQVGDVIPYTVLRDSGEMVVDIELQPYPLARIASANWGTIAFALVYLPVVAYVFLRRPKEPAARILLLAGAALFAATTWSLGLQANGFVYGFPLWLHIVTTSGAFVLYWIASLHFALVFPQRLPLVEQRRWLLPVLYALPYVFIVAFIAAGRAGAANVLDWLAGWWHPADVSAAAYLASALPVVIYQYRLSKTDETRSKIRWLMFAALLVGSLALLLYLLPPFLGISAISSNVIGALGVIFPVAVAVAILRHNLFDIDTLLNRTMVYGALTAIIAGFYVLAVTGTGLALQSNSPLAGGLLTAVVVIALYKPLRTALQRGADRLVPVSAITPPDDPPHALTREAAQPEPVAAPTALSGSWLGLARAGWYLLAGLSFIILVAALPGYLALFPEGPHADGFVVDFSPALLGTTLLQVLFSIGTAVLSIILAWVIFRRHSGEKVALLLAYYLLLHGTIMAGPLEALEPLIPGIRDFNAYVLSPLILLPVSYLLFAVFPDGRFVPPWTRRMVLASFLLGPISFTIPYHDGPQFNNTFFWFAAIVWLVISFFMLYAQIYRYRRVSTPEQRQQTKWFVFGLITWFIVMVVSSVPYMMIETLPPGSPFPWWALAGSLLWGIGLAIVPVSLTVAVTRYRLYHIDVIINRTLVYGALTATVVAIYALVVGGVGVVFQSSGNLLVSLLATGLVAVFFQPLRERLQQTVNRMMFGERDDPYQVLRQLGQRLESSGAPAAVLPAIVETVAETLKLPHAEITLKRRGRFEPAAQYGRASGAPASFPIQYQSETIGYLRVSPRFSKEDLTEADEELLRQIARQTGPAARAVQLTKDLQSSRVHLVTAREEERRRLRRDLHDGLGPVLASQGLKMAAASQLMRDDPEKAQQILEELAAQNESTVSEIRRLVYDLRPAALDDLGLVGAVRDYAAALTQNDAGAKGVQIDVQQPAQGLPPLSAAVEVAAYRIAVEAVTNVTRHARAKRCSISFQLETGNFGDFLRLEIADDGVGIPIERKAGVGLTSMRERAEELGGTFQIDTKIGEGSRIILRLPLPDES